MSIHKKMIDKFGAEKQLLICVEEMQELSKEILKYVNRGSCNNPEIVEELHDVLFCLEYVSTHLCVKDDEIEKGLIVRFKKCEKLLRGEA